MLLRQFPDMGNFRARRSKFTQNGGNRPDWLPPGALAYGHFLDGHYWLNGREVSLAEFVSETRAGTAYDLCDSAGAIASYGTNIARLNDRGLLIEPAHQSTAQYSNDPANAVWANTNVTLGTTTGGFIQVLETVTSGLHRLFRTTGISVVTGQVHTFFAIIKKRGRRYVYLRINSDGANNRNIGFDLDTVSVTFAGSGYTGAIEKIGDTFILSATVTPTNGFPAFSIGTSTASVTSDTVPANFAGDTAQGFDFFNLDVVLGSRRFSPVINTNTTTTLPADAYSTTLVGSGSHDVTFTFDDASTQTISGVSAGVYAYPTNLSRPLVTSIVWGDV